MTDQEVEKMLDSNFYRLGLDPRAVFYANYLWWAKGEQRADEWIKRYRTGRYFVANPPIDGYPIYSSDWSAAREEMERFYRREIPVELTRVERDRQLNRAAFEDRVRIAMLTRMLQIAGFPASSPEFKDLERQAVKMSKEIDREAYLAYMTVQADFERMRKTIEEAIRSDGAKPTATRATIAEKNQAIREAVTQYLTRDQYVAVFGSSSEAWIMPKDLLRRWKEVAACGWKNVVEVAQHALLDDTERAMKAGEIRLVGTISH